MYFKLFLRNFLTLLNQYTNFTEPFPKHGFIVKKYYFKKQLFFYKVISRRSQEVDTQGVKEVDIQLIISVINGNQVVNKTVNKSAIKARYIDGNFYIQEGYTAELQTILIFAIKQNSKDLELRTLSWEQIANQFKEKKLKYINIIPESAYIQDLRLIKKGKQMRRQIKSLEGILTPQSRITFLKVFRTVILAQLDIEQNLLQSQLIKLINISKLRAYAMDKVNSVSMEFRNMTNEMDMISQKFPDHLLKSFSKRVTKLYLNFGQVRGIQFLQILPNLKVLFPKEQFYRVTCRSLKFEIPCPNMLRQQLGQKLGASGRASKFGPHRWNLKQSNLPERY